MSDLVTVEVAGGRELAETLRGMPEQCRKRWLRTAMRNGAKVVLERAKANAPIRHENVMYSRLKADGGWGGPRSQPPGTLRRSLAVSVSFYKRSGIMVARVGPRTGYDRTHVGRLLEKGFRLKVRNPVTGVPTGEVRHIAPTFWLSKAFISEGENAIRKVMDSLHRSIKLYARRQARAQAKRAA